jgi:hypothetical protein
MDSLHRLSIYISIVMGFDPKKPKPKVSLAELAA